ncbi:MAG: oxidoreductase [Pseudomonadota bacterium]|jgi:predicted DsbA family dithiol-disulfide isomerase
MSQQLLVDIWSDLACPWCYIGKRRFEKALAQFAHNAQVTVTWRSFELDPSAPVQRDTSVSHAQRIAQKYGMPVAEAEQRVGHVVAMAAGEGLPFDFEHIKSGNTFNAHRLLHLARERGLGDALKERLFRAYLCEGTALGDSAQLLTLASDVGLDVDETQGVLATDSYSREVRADQSEAKALGVDGVPFFRIGRYGVSGAQASELLLRALEKAWSELPVPLVADSGDIPTGSVCGPDGCS